MNDSTNIRIIADNIRKLEKMVKEAGSELPTPGAGDAGKILKVGSDGYELATEYSYTPPTYSTTEVNTGYKWIDNRDIYRIVFEGNFEAQTGVFNPVYGVVQNAEAIMVNGFLTRIDDYTSTLLEHFNTGYNESSGNLYSLAVPDTYSEGKYTVIFEYVKKPSPEPSNETKKKTTKKG